METFSRSEDFEEPALEWLYREAEDLREALAAAGISDEATQRTVCEQYLFGLATRLDGSEVEDPQPPRPALGFHTPDGPLMADDSFSFHDYALGVVGQVFGDD